MNVRGQILRAGLLAGTAVVLAVPTAAAAQTEAADETGDSVIIVTAQKRDQNLQDVPLAITAIGGETLEARGIDDVTDLDAAVPGLTVGRSGSDARPAIRGVRTEEVDVFNDPSIGFFVDGVYKPRTSQALAAFVDLERVEVLRGPQGTLFGRNTYGGSVSLITARPRFTFGAEGTVQYANFNDLRTEAVLNAPLGPNTAVRFAGVYQESDGYVNVLPSRNGLPAAEDFNDNDQVYFRGSFLHDVGPGEILVTLSHWDQGGYGAGGFGYTTVGSLRNSAGQLDLGGTLNRNNSRTGAFAGPSDLGPYDVYRNTNMDRDTEETALNIQASLDLGPVTLRSISGWSDFTSLRVGDEDFSEANFNTLALDTRSKSLSQEIQLVSNGNGALQYVFGGYYFHENAEEDFVFRTVPTSGLFSFLQEVDTDSYAAFGQVDYGLTEQLKVTLGARYTVDDKRFRYRTPSSDAVPDVDTARSDDAVTWRAGLEFSPTPDNLIYATASTGFRSGGANNNVAAQQNYGIQKITAFELGSKNTFAGGAGIANLSLFYNDMDDILANTFVPFGPTQVVARSNAGQARAYGAELELAYEFTRDFRVYGNFAYLDAKFQTFQVSLPSGYTRATGYTFVPGTTNQLDLSGNDVPLSPTFTATIGASYKFDVGFGTIEPAAQLYYSDSYFTNEFNYDAGISDRDVGRQRAYTKSDASITFRTPDEGVFVQALVRNIENEAVLNRTVIGGGGAIFQNYGQPRTYGVRAGFKF